MLKNEIQLASPTINWRELDAFTIAYLECALWSSTDESTPSGGQPMDNNYSLDDCTQAFLRQAAADCLVFQRDNEADLNCEGSQSTVHAGHDFWLTRNRHGAGFWDGDWPDAEGKRLTDAAHAFGEVNLYVTDNGQIDAM